MPIMRKAALFLGTSSPTLGAAESPHNCTLPARTPAARAFDFALYAPGGTQLDWDPSDDQWQTAIGFIKALNLVSGSTFHGIPDNDHAEMASWQTA